MRDRGSVIRPNRPTASDQVDSVRRYLDEACRHPLLTRIDETNLAQRIEDGAAAQGILDDPAAGLSPVERRALLRRIVRGEDAHRTFVLANLRLVVSIAKRYQASGVPLLDLIQEGNIGLIRAVEKFDHRKGFKFSTYATWWIRQAVSRGVANTSRLIRLPLHASDLRRRVQQTREWLTLRLGRTPTLVEIAAELDLDEDRIREMVQLTPDALSLQEAISEDGEMVLGDLVADNNATAPDDAAVEAMLPTEIDRLLADLDDRERRIIELRFGLHNGEPQTLEQIGDAFELTRERIRQIEGQILAKLRGATRAAIVAELMS
jgi:RNA polymerase sigma factor (sigma-70 family)